MRTLQFTVLVLLGCWLAGHTVCSAEISYVTDVTQITMRTGPSIQNKIVLMLRSGQPVEVEKVQDEWSYVRLPNREPVLEGWVLSQYLVTRLPWEVKSKKLAAENGQLKEKLARVQAQLTETTGQGQEAAQDLKQTALTLGKLQKDYEALKKGSTKYLELKAEYDTTKEALNESLQKVRELTRENDVLQASQDYKWFGMGASVLLFGMLVGLIAGKRQKKMKSGIVY